ncbi:MAG: hypothetical protein AB7G44_05005 [Bacteroidia bacterium]
MITDYNISFNTWLGNLMQWFDAGQKTMAWLRVLISPIEYVHTQFLAFRDIVNREASYNGQVMVMERMLNIQYYDADAWASPPDPTAGGRIWIAHTLSSLPSNYLFYQSEGQEPPYIYYDSENQQPVYVYYEQEYYSAVAFTIMVPVSLTFNQDEMKARINKLRIAGFNYTIQTY